MYTLVYTNYDWNSIIIIFSRTKYVLKEIVLYAKQKRIYAVLKTVLLFFNLKKTSHLKRI